MIIAVASRRGSPGVTTLVGLLGRYWPDSDIPRFLLEADPAGGVLAARWAAVHGMSWQPGILELASARREYSLALLNEAAQSVAPSVAVLPAPPVPARTRSALGRLAGPLVDRFASDDEVCIVVDCGRLTVDSPALALGRAAVVTLLVCAPTLEQVQTVAPAARELAEHGCTLGLVTVGDGPYHSDEVAEVVGVPLVGHVDSDHRAAAAFRSDGFAVRKGFDRSRLGRQARELATRTRELATRTREVTARTREVARTHGATRTQPGLDHGPQPGLDEVGT